MHKDGYFRELLASNPDIDEGLRALLRLCREIVVRLQKTESALVRSLESDALLVDRVERLMTIPAVGPITALPWALEVGDVQRFSSITEYALVKSGCRSLHYACSRRTQFRRLILRGLEARW